MGLYGKSNNLPSCMNCQYILHVLLLFMKTHVLNLNCTFLMLNEINFKYPLQKVIPLSNQLKKTFRLNISPKPFNTLL